MHVTRRPLLPHAAGQRVRVSPFWMDATEVTNAQFAAFVKATGYKTVAERPVDWEALKRQLPPDTPKPDESRLQPGALVFTPPAGSPVGREARSTRRSAAGSRVRSRPGGTD